MRPRTPDGWHGLYRRTTLRYWRALERGDEGWARRWLALSERACRGVLGLPAPR